MSRPKTDILSVRISKEVIAKIDEIAVKEGQDRNGIARQIIENYFKKNRLDNYISIQSKLDKIIKKLE